MKITNGKDYYDNALSYGQDDNTVFRREKNRFVDTVPVPMGVITLTVRRPYQYLDLAYGHRTIKVKNRDHLVARTMVIFCGKIYRGIMTSVEGDTTYIWHQDKIEEWLEHCGLKIDSKSKNLSGCEPASKQLLDWLITNQVVVAICFSGSGLPIWAINSDQLKDVQFYRVLDSYAAFQEIAMWIGGVLPNQSAIPMEIDNQTRIAKHGFDKNSFRRAKQ